MILYKFYEIFFFNFEQVISFCFIKWEDFFPVYQNDSQQLPVIWTTGEASDETDADDDNHLQKKSCNEKLMKSTEIRCNNHVHAMAKTTKKNAWRRPRLENQTHIHNSKKNYEWKAAVSVLVCQPGWG